MAKKSNRLSKKDKESLRWIGGVVLLGVGVMLLVACVSYYFTWSDDYTWLHSGTGTVRNAIGKLGARTGSWLVGEWFGVMGVCVPIVAIILAFRLLRVRKLYLERSIRILLLVMVLGSITLALLFGQRGTPPIFGTGAGGEIGGWVSAYLTDKMGVLGTLLVVIVVWILLAVYITTSTITIINRAGEKGAEGAKSFFSWAKNSVEARITKGNERRAIREQEREAERARIEAEKAARNRPDLEVVAPKGEPQIAQVDKPIVNVAPTIPVRQTEPDLEIIRRDVEPEPEIVPEREEEQLMVDEYGFTIVSADGVPQPIAKPKSAPSVGRGMVGAGGVLEVTDDGEMQVISRQRVDVEADEIEDVFDPTKELSRYQRPPVELLQDHSSGGVRISEEEIRANKDIIRAKLSDFGINVSERIKATIGPTVTLYEIEPAQGVKISKIRSLEEDIALALKVQSIRIVTLGAGRGTVGIEVPNSTRETVSMMSVIRSAKFQECNYKLPIALGRTIYNEVYIDDLTKMPHLLVAGATGQGKSVGLNAIITSLLYKKHPAELKFVLVDPKQVELSVYSKLEKHFLAKMESEEQAILTDTQKVVYTLHSLINLMEQRYTLLREGGERNIADYNAKFLARRLNPKKGHHFMPYIVVVVDEFADMIMTAGKEVEIPITRIAQKARAVGIHLIIATQRPDVKVITGLIKSNIPARMAFKVVSMVDSRTIIDQPGANNLVGMGDMLMMKSGELTRIQCAFIDTPEIERIVNYIGNQQGYASAYELPDYVPETTETTTSREDMGRLDEKFEEIARWVVESQEGSTSAIQRRFEIGYNRAGRITDQLERAGIVGKSNGSKPREVLVYDMAVLERLFLELL